jgi:hypothetical protein
MAEGIGEQKLLHEFEGTVRYKKLRIIVHTSGEAAENIRRSMQIDPPYNLGVETLIDRNSAEEM